MGEQIHVAFVIQKYPPFIGGAERQALLLATLISSRVDTCDVFTAQPSAEQIHGVRLRSIGINRGGILKHIINFILSFVHFLWNGKKYSIVHGYSVSGLTCGAILGARLRGTQTVLKICSIGEDGEIAKLIRNPIGKRIFRYIARSNTFVVPTPSVASAIVPHGVPAWRIAVIPNAVAVESNGHSRSAIRRDLGLPEKTTVLFAGRMVPGKGLELLCSAWEHVSADATLLLLGGGPEADPVSEWCKRNRNVCYLGPKRDVNPYYGAADILVAPSASETFGNTVAEGMSHGLPVITTPVGLARHWLRHRENGMIISGNSSQEMASMLKELIQDAQLRNQIGSAAREEVTRNFSPASVADQYMNLYRQLITRGNHHA